MKAGAATVKITPDEPMWLAGWAVRREPATGTGMDLFAKALALEDSAGRLIIIVTADLIAIPASLARTVAERCGVARDCILFNASHTHNGPEVRPDKVPFFDIPPEFAAKILPYVDSLAAKLTDVIQRALSDLKPAAMWHSQSSADFAHNRRKPPGFTAHDVPVLIAAEKGGKEIAIVFGYACHNLALPAEYCQYHGDYAGVAQELVERLFPGAVALFLAGAGADQDPDPRGRVDMALAHGIMLYSAVRKSVNSLKPVEDLLASAFAEIPLNFQPMPSREELEKEMASGDALRARKARYLLEHLVFAASYPCPVQVLRFGNELVLIALGGEPVMDYEVALKQKFNGPLVWVAGYSNDMFGYLPSRRVLSEGGYEGGRALLWSALPAPFTDDVEERIIAGALRLAAKLGITYSATP